MSPRIPSYRLHKGSGQALVQINGERIYLGKHGTPESHEKYRRLIAEWLANAAEGAPKKVVPAERSPSALLIDQLLAAYWDFAKTYYVKDGAPTKELACMKDAMRPVRKLYSRTPATEFGPLALKAVRQHMIEVEELSRGVINNRVNRIKRIFKWAVSEELIPSSVYESLRTVVGLRYGRTTARETEPVKPVADVTVDATLPFVPPQVAAMIRLQRCTGMRPCEVVMIRPGDIDQSEDVWIYRPHDHKNRWRGHDKAVPLGPKAQDVLRPFLLRGHDDYCFSPRESDEWRRANRPLRFKEDRKTPVYPSELKQRERAKQQRKSRASVKAERFTTETYRAAIMYGMKKAKREGVEITHWHPHQLRHSCATEVRKRFGVEAAQVYLGHSKADVTQIYAERDLQLGIKVAAEVG